jgi:hypothetical protein
MFRSSFRFIKTILVIKFVSYFLVAENLPNSYFTKEQQQFIDIILKLSTLEFLN